MIGPCWSAGYLQSDPKRDISTILLRMDNLFIAATLTLLAFLLIAALLKPAADRFHIPLPVLLVIAGMGLGLISSHWELPWSALTETSVFGELIMFILLPTLVFETASRLDTDQLLENHRAILYLSSLDCSFRPA
jgi:NhaP-type Na+/H+ or K+/H+ antiporter